LQHISEIASSVYDVLAKTEWDQPEMEAQYAI